MRGLAGALFVVAAVLGVGLYFTLENTRYAQKEAERLRQEAEEARSQVETQRARLAELAEQALRETREEATSEPAPPEEPLPAPQLEPEYAVTIADLRNWMATGDPLNLLTEQSIEDSLEARGRPAGLLAAAALLPGTDSERALALLEEALEKDPTSPLVLSALTTLQAREGIADEGALARIETLREVDPTNGLADVLAARWHLDNGDDETAREALRSAASKTHLDDHFTQLMPHVEAFYADVGCSPAAARSLSLFELPVGSLLPLRQVTMSLAEQAATLAARGDAELALALTRDGAQVSNRLSSSGRFMVHDLVGIACEERFLQEQRAILEATGQELELQRIDARIRNNGLRKKRTRAIASALTSVMENYTEEQIVSFMDQVRTSGELAALMQLPEVRKILAELEANQ